MLKLTQTGIGLLTKQYRSVLRKCLLLNLGLFFPILTSVYGDTIWLNKWQYHPFDYPDAMMLSYGDGNVYAYNSWNAYGRVYLKNGTDTSTFQYLTKNGNYTDRYLSRCSDADSSTYGEAYCFNGIGNEYVTVQSNIAKLDYALYNYYYTFRVDERVEAIDSASFFQKDFSTLQEVDLQSKNPTHLGAFAKCDEVCPRLSERFSLSLSQEQMLKNDASVDAGTFSICSLQIENVNEKLSNVFDV